MDRQTSKEDLQERKDTVLSETLLKNVSGAQRRSRTGILSNKHPCPRQWASCLTIVDVCGHRNSIQNHTERANSIVEHERIASLIG